MTKGVDPSRSTNYLGRVASIRDYARVIRKFIRFFGLAGISVLWRTQFSRSPVVVPIPGTTHRVVLRPGTVDRVTFREVFMEGLYEFPGYGEPDWIIDVGANVGFVSVFFALRFPAARILAVEPEPRNAEVARHNTETFDSITLVEAAVLARNGYAKILDDSSNADCFQFARSANAMDGSVPAVTIESLCQDFGVERIDVLKMDIEGSEREVLADSAGWLPKTRVLAIELHEQIAPGVRRVFETAIGSRRHHIFEQGATTFVTFD